MNITITTTNTTLEGLLSSTQKNLAIKIKGSQPNFTFILQNQDAVNNILLAFKLPAVNGDTIITTGGNAVITMANLADLNLTASAGTISAALLFKEAGPDIRIVNLGTTSLAAGASTSALQSTGNTALAAVQTSVANIPAKGAAIIANSTPISVASDQVVPVSATSLPLPTGASTSALQTSGNASLTALIGAIIAQGASPAGITQVLIGANVSSSSPVYTAGNVNPLSQTTTGQLRVSTQGAVSSGATNAGNPNKIAGVFNTTPATVTSGQVVDLQTSARGSLLISSGSDPINTNVPANTLLSTYSVQITTNATTTPTASTAYVSSITVATVLGGTTSTLTIQDKQGTPLKLINGLTTVAITTTPTTFNFQTPIKMVSGIDIITAGGVSATVNAWINYYQ